MMTRLSMLVTALFLVDGVSCFSGPVRLMGRSKAFVSRTPLRALIFGDYDSYEVVSSEFDSAYNGLGGHDDMCELEDDGSNIWDQCARVNFARRLSLDEDRIAALARLAVAFSPPEQALDLENIHEVRVLMVRDNGMDISAVVCDEQQCVTLLVPVAFPRSCLVEYDEDGLIAKGGRTSMEECVMDNLGLLDMQAQDFIRRLEKQNDSFLPYWWVAASSRSELADECESVRSLLSSRDFDDEVSALASLAIGSNYRVDGAEILAVGPAGICLRARVWDRAGATSVMDVSLPFAGPPATDALSLRAHILAAVDSVSVPRS